MKIKVENLGTIKQAELSLGDFTIICGNNNTGKTYITYSIYGFLSLWKDFLSFDITDDQIDELFNSGILEIEILDYLDKVDSLVKQVCQNSYKPLISLVFATPFQRFLETQFNIEVDVKESIISELKYQQKFNPFLASQKEGFFSILKDIDSTLLSITLLSSENSPKIPKDTLKKMIGNVLTAIIFQPLFPNSFIASVERTGISIFRKRFLFEAITEPILNISLDQSRKELIEIAKTMYPLPIIHNLEFIKSLETIANNKSFLVEENSELLEDFTDIIGGNYTINENDQLYFIPKAQNMQLSMDESSSAVRSLIMIGFYLKHQAQKGDLLMIDEPELNLHPENQRRVARLLARLVNLGIKVFVTTHSDYFIKELNTLIMLNQDKSYLQQIAQEEGYRNDELLSADQVKVYVTEEVIENIEEKPQKTGFYNLTEASITQELGIEVKSFDTAIETMNRIQEAIIWGE